MRRALGVALLLASVAWAHGPERSVVRELVWLKGHRAPAPARLTLLALGAEHPFAVTEVRRFPVGGESPAEGELERARFALQGPRDHLARFAAARPDQTITILAERRPGGGDLFVLALDLCPAR